MVTYNDYLNLTSNTLSEGLFERYRIKAERMFYNATETIDGVVKLKEFPPTDEDDLKAIEIGICDLIDTLYAIDNVANAQNNAFGYEMDESGALRGRVIASKSSGSESISFSAGGAGGTATAVSKAVSDRAERSALLGETVIEALRGINDANGVPLLYGGAYPYKR